MKAPTPLASQHILQEGELDLDKQVVSTAKSKLAYLILFIRIHSRKGAKERAS
jgi:hypothetical protein